MRAATVLLALVLLFAACGGGDSDGAELERLRAENAQLGAELAASPPATATPTTTVTAALPASALVLLDVFVSDDTTSNPPGTRMEIWVRGYGSWFPNLRFGGERTQLGKFPVGETHERDFYIYPDGRDGTEIRVPFTMKAEMISGSDKARTVVSIEDAVVRVWGEAIDGFELVFGR